jgi:hypothetical protein
MKAWDSFLSIVCHGNHTWVCSLCMFHV